MKKGNRVEIFRGSNGDYYWHIKAANNKVTESSGEGYKTKWGAKRAVKRRLNVDDKEMKIVYPLLAVLLVALVWALATRTTTENVIASNGTGQIAQQPIPSNVASPQPSTGMEQPTTQFQGK